MKRAQCLAVVAGMACAVACIAAPTALWRRPNQRTGEPIPSRLLSIDASGVLMLQAPYPGNVITSRFSWASLRPDQLNWICAYYWPIASNFPAPRAYYYSRDGLRAAAARAAASGYDTSFATQSAAQ